MFQSNVLDRFSIFKKKSRKSFPKHIAITVEDNFIWQRKNKKNSEDTFNKRDNILLELMKMQVSMNLPIMSLFVLPEGRREGDELESFVRLFEKLPKDLFHKYHIKLSVLGKWYDLPGKLVESIKYNINETKSYDRFFLNLCVNYDGQSEIVDACKLIARKIIAKNLEINDINKEIIKENLYSSYFLSPDLLIKTGLKNSWSNLLLWDSADAFYYFTEKAFNDISKSDIEKAVGKFYG